MVVIMTAMNDGHKMYSGATATCNCYGTGAIRPRPAGDFEEEICTYGRAYVFTPHAADGTKKKMNR